MQVVLCGQVDGLGGLCLSAFLQALGLLALAVHLDDFQGALGGDGGQVGRHALVAAVGDHVGEDIGLEEEEFAVHRLERDFAAGQSAAGLDVLVNLVVHAALQLGALACQLLRVEADVLEAGSCRAHAVERTYPRGAAQLAPTGAEASDAACLLAHANLFHLDAHVEEFGQHLDELAEVDTPLGNIIEDGLVAVALILHVADFHLQPQVLGGLAATYHGAVLAGFGFLVLLDVDRPGYAIDALDFLARLHVGLLHLQRHEAARHGDDADVVARRCFDGHDVALLDGQVVVVTVVSLSCVFELHLHQVRCVLVVGQVGQVVMDVQLALVASAALCPESSFVVSTDISHCRLKF